MTDVAAIVTRQSRLATGEDPSSTRDQLRRAEAGGAVWGYETRPELIFEEVSVSGGRKLEERPGLLPAVEAIEAGLANVLVVTYYDRLARSVVTAENAIERVEARGGKIIALDLGPISHSSAASWTAATYAMVGNEGYRRSIGERTHNAKIAAVAEGRPIFRFIPLGYLKAADRTLVVDEAARPYVVQAFEMRAEGRTLDEIRAMLREAGYELTYSRVEYLLRNRLYLGELRWGSKEKRTYIENLTFCPPIVPRELFERVQGARSVRGRIPKSPRLLARLGVLRCSSCGSRLGIANGGVRGGKAPIYKCGAPTGDCPRRVTISAAVVEDLLLEICEELLEEIQGRASVGVEVEEARLAAERDEAKLASTIRALAELEGEAASAEVLAELKAKRDSSRAHYDRLLALSTRTVTVSSSDLRGLPLEEQRDVIVALLRSVKVGPGVPGNPNRETIKARLEVDAFETELVS